MEKTTKNDDSSDIIRIISEILESKKCDDISVLNLENINSYLSWFVIATSGTSTQARAASREIQKAMKSYRKINTNRGIDDSGWILLDYGDIIVHIMTPDLRNFYDLDKLWGDSKKIS